jgi:hypothetical protein
MHRIELYSSWHYNRSIGRDEWGSNCSIETLTGGESFFNLGQNTDARSDVI